MEPHFNQDHAMTGNDSERRRSLVATPEIAGDAGDGSMAEMAERDLDAALQLLADRAQYITGASGAAIALRREGRNELLCRATTGENAPELGALFSTEFGLSGESVRTRKALRCDDAERDARVNREVCRQMGIASVVVMPVVNDDEVLGVFELFSGQANAFEERDLSAIERLSAMVETAVRLARASQNLALQKGEEQTEVEGAQAESLIAAVEAPQRPNVETDAATVPDAASMPVADGPVVPTLSQNARKDGAPIVEALQADGNIVDAIGVDAPAEISSAVEMAPEAAAPKRPLFWSANSVAETATAERADERAEESRVPPMLRSLRKCAACGFPVSAGRVLCVECEEKKWRGQSIRPKAGAMVASAANTATRAAAAAAGAGVTTQVSTLAPGAKARTTAARPVAKSEAAEASREMTREAATVQAPEFVLSAGLEPEQSWLSRNRYLVGVLLAAGVAAAAMFCLR